MTSPHPGTYTQGGQAALAEALAQAVPAWVRLLADLPLMTRVIMRAQTDAAMAEADTPWVDGDASWETSAAFLALARSLALDAYRPGGVTYLGVHWEATRDDHLGVTTTVTAQGEVL